MNIPIATHTSTPLEGSDAGSATACEQCARIASGELVTKEEYEKAVRMWQEMHSSFERSRDEELEWKRKLDAGELIVKSELVEWLCKQGDTPFKHPNMEVRGYNIAIKDVLDHINKKGSDHTR